MTRESLRFSLDESTEGDIRAHLTRCDSQFQPPLSKRLDIEAYARKVRDKASTFEAWHRKSLVGLVAAYMNAPEKRCFITNVSVAPNFTGKRVAETLMKACLEHAQSAHITSISLEVSPASGPAIHLYEKLGFRVVEERSGFLTMWRPATTSGI